MKNQINEFIDYIVNEKNYSENTVIAYKNDLLEFYEFLYKKLEKNIDVRSVKKLHIKSFLKTIIQNDLEKTTYNRKLASIKSFFSYLFKYEIIDSNPASIINSLRKDSLLPKFATIVQIDDIFNNLQDNDFL